MLYYGIVGRGRWAKQIRLAFDSSNEWECVFEHGKDSVPELIKNPVDLIIIATAYNTHLDVLKKYQAFCKNFLICKPVVMTKKELKELKKICKNNINIFAEHTFLYNKNISNDTNKKINKKNIVIKTWTSTDQGEAGLKFGMLPHDLSIVEDLVGLKNYKIIKYRAKKRKIKLNIKTNGCMVKIKIFQSNRKKKIILIDSKKIDCYIYETEPLKNESLEIIKKIKNNESEIGSVSNITNFLSSLP